MKCYSETLKEQIKSLNKNYGKVAVSKNPKNKYYNLRTEIYKNTEFLSKNESLKNRIYYILNDLYTLKKCSCGCEEVLTNPYKKYIRGHSNKIKEVQEKKIKSCLNNYGVCNPSQSNEITLKKKKTYEEHYGVSHFMKTEEGKKSIEQTILKRYGVKNIFQNEDVKKTIQKKWKDNKEDIVNKIIKTNKTKFYKKIIEGDRLKGKFTPLFNKEEYFGVGDEKYKFKCLKCETVCESNLDDGFLPRCFTCNPLITSGGQSIVEKNLIDFIKKYEKNVKIQNRKEIFPYELDIFLPDKKIAIELDGLYWHSELRGKDSKYHLNKTKLCLNKNIQLIHIFEDEWIKNSKIVKSRLKNILGLTKYNIGARKCNIKIIDNTLKDKFLNKYHIQGSDNSGIRLGAFYKNRLISVMTFGKNRKSLGKNVIKNEYELMRFASISNFNVTGIASKLLKCFEKTYNPKKIISYADLRWSQGDLYNKLGFNLLHISRPSYWYTKDYLSRVHRFNFRKSILKNKLEIFNPSLTEWENMQANGWDRIWDCGNYVFEKKYN